ncbi:MAG: AarF/ABC1/UbiB kinase family protein [Acidimicrobiales bacterium]
MNFRRFLGLAGLASVIGAVAVRRRSATATEQAVLGNRMAARNLRLARMGLRGGRRYAVSKARQTFASAERKEELALEFQMQTAADVTRELGNMKGAMMKIGQMASYIDTGLPDNVRQTLASLQHDAPPMSPELAAATLRAELGAGPDELFAEWDPIPIASASIGQVHRAITLDDRAVAVKIQYPGVADAVRSDLGNADWIFGAMSSMFPGLESGPIANELKERLYEELDYENEAANQRYFAEFFDGHPRVHVPKVIDELSGPRVLTTELATGHRFDEVLTWDQHEKNLIGETIFRFSFGSIYRLHAFNGDPHPGNYLFDKGGRVTFLDFGLVKRFTPEETQLFEDLITKMVLERDDAGFRKLVEDAGLLKPNAPFSDEQVEDYFRFYYRYVLDDAVITIDQEYAEGGVNHLFDKSGPHSELMAMLNVPPSFVVLQRITLGLIGILAQLEATLNYRRVAEELWPFVGAPPSTPMGEEIEHWRRGRHESHVGL